MLYIFLLICSLSAQENKEVQFSTTNYRPKVPSYEQLAPERINFFSILTGPKIKNLENLDQSEGDSLNQWNQVSFQWKMTKDTYFVANPRFVMTYNPEDNRSFDWDNPVFGVVTKWYESGNFRFAGGVNSIIPLLRTESTKEDGLIFNPGGFNDLNYRISYNWEIGTWLWARLLFYNRSTNNENNRVSYFAAPRIKYTFSDNFNTMIFYQINGVANSNYKFIIENEDSLNLMLSYQINSRLTLEPILTLLEEDNFNTKSMQLNLWISMRIL